MQLRIAALADYTNITDNGKLNILGIFSQIHAVSVPATHPQMQFVVQFAFEPIETGDKAIRIHEIHAGSRDRRTLHSARPALSRVEDANAQLQDAVHRSRK